mmetsp:Transcript_61692/g.191546  ORF Transcript_61692/g.191546 Transcript_61692/m.191546 type:complete len:720 (+) Transcript_61692:295-2454(+)
MTPFPRSACVVLSALAAVALMVVVQQSFSAATQLPGTAAASPEPVDEAAAAPGPLALAARYITIDVSALRWFWWPAILYLFWGMAYVCDVYFVRTIEVISERFEIPDDVAGATLMALGCNGPELALNTISIFHPSNIGVGAVIGGEVFNVLVIIGTALLATPDAYLPLKLGPFTFFRDVLFYIASVALLYWVLRDGMVTRAKSLVLLAGAALYITTVVFSSQLRSFLSRSMPRRMLRRSTKRLTNRLSKRLSRKVTFALGSASQASLVESDPAMDSEDSEPEIAQGADPEMVAHWLQARRCTEPSEGSVLGVRVEMRNRLMDRGHRVEERFVWLREDALLVSAAVDPTEGRRALGRAESGVVYEHAEKEERSHWHHGGLVNRPTFIRDEPDDGSGSPLSKAFSATPISQLSRPLLNEPTPKRKTTMLPPKDPSLLELSGFREAPWEVIPLEDVLYCEPPEDKKHFTLHVHQHDSELGNLITLEFSAKRNGVLDAWTEALSSALKEQRRRTADAPPPRSWLGLLMEWVEWLQFPVKFLMKVTIPDMDNPKLQHLYPVSFFMSMVWLAVFAYSVVKACDGIHEDFGISVTVLGFTVAAAGTSFPNVFSGMVVARQGKTSMAIANALGANVQNVFLALAIPWAIQSNLIVGGPFPMVVKDLLPAVVECGVTLIPVVMVFLCCKNSMPGWAGGLFLVTYLVYLIFALGQQITGCDVWPLPCAM